MKKLRNILFILVSLFSLVALSSCDVDKFDETLDGKFPPTGTVMTIQDAKKLVIGAAEETPKYYFNAVIKEITDETSGDMYITDEFGEYSIRINDCYNKDGTKKFSELDPKPKVGDTVKLYSRVKRTGTEILLFNAWIVEHTPQATNPEDEYEDISILEATVIGQGQANNVYTEEKYLITGKITEIRNATYGNMYISDDLGNNLYIYGLYSKDGSIRFDAMEAKPSEGDTITILAMLGQYSGNAQAKEAKLYNVVPSNPTTTDSVNFFMINDTHGALLDSGDGNSIGRVDTLLKRLESNDGQYISIVNGDAFQGSYVSSTLYGKPLIESFNEMNITAFVVGNHDFDWGIDKMALYKDGDLSNGEANFPFLGANIFYKGTSTSPEFIDPYTVVEYGDMKVGIIGIIGGDQESDILTQYVEDYNFVNDPTSIVQKWATHLRNVEDCDSVVVATHDYNEYYVNKYANLTGTSKVDAIFCAHTHQKIMTSVIRSDGKNIAVVENGDKNDTAVTVKLYYDSYGNYLSYESKMYEPENYAISNNIQTVINSYSDLIEESERVLGYTGSYISKGTLGKYAYEGLLSYDYSAEGYEFGSIDVAIINTGGVRATIQSGNITAAEVFEVFPFENAVVLVNIDGKSLKSLYEKNSDYLYVGTSKSAGAITRFNDNTIYQLAIIDYVFTSTLSSYDVFDSLPSSEYIYTDIILRNVLIDYLDSIY